MPPLRRRLPDSRPDLYSDRARVPTKGRDRLLFRTAGTFIGTFILARYSNVRFFRINIIAALAAVIGLLFAGGEYPLYVLYAVVGFTIANIFSIIFSVALRHRPEKANEISGLMITGVFGGAIVSFLMGWASDAIGSQSGGLYVILFCIAYLLYCSMMMREPRPHPNS